jgi:opacity protein-like surface antigen
MKKLKHSMFSILMGAVIFTGITISASSLHANDNGDWGSGFALSFPQAAGDTKDYINRGFGFDLNVTYQKPDSIFGLRFDGIYAGFQLTDQVIENVSHADQGYANVWGAGANLMLTPKSAEKFKPHLYAGPGFYYQHAEATRYGYSNGYVCDPYWGCYPSSSGQYSVASQSTSRLGWQGGAGLEVCFDSGGALTLDVQYVSINNTNANLEFMPLNIGYEWHF